MKPSRIEFPRRVRQATWFEQYEAVLVGDRTLVIWRLDGKASEAVAVLAGRRELERLAKRILGRQEQKQRERRAARRRARPRLRVVHGGKR